MPGVLREVQSVALIKATNSRTITGTGVTSKAVGVAIIQVPFVTFSMLIDVNFLVKDQNIPTLLSVKYMLENEQWISIQGC